jgi:hypothetical protein
LLPKVAARRFAVAAGAALALACAGEIALRFAQRGAPFWYEPDAQLGWRLRANAQGFEGDAYARITTAGRRDLDYPVDKPNGVYRIAVLGDEDAEAFGVPIRYTWWGQLARQLERCGFQSAKHVEVLNFGVGGYGTAQEYVMLQTAAMRYQPDLVLLQFANRDDVMDNASALAANRDRPFFMLDPRGEARIDDSFADSPSFEARSQFRYRMLSELADRSRLVQLALRASAVRMARAAPAGLAALAPPRDAAWESAWRVTEALIGKMNDYARRNGAKLAVIAVPASRQLADPGLDYPDQRLTAFGAKHGIPVLTLAAAMRGAPAPLYAGSGAMNPAGHEAAAQLIARGLCAAPGAANAPIP